MAVSPWGKELPMKPGSVVALGPFPAEQKSARKDNFTRRYHGTGMEIPADARQSVHQAWKTIAWSVTSAKLTSPINTTQVQ